MNGISLSRRLRAIGRAAWQAGCALAVVSCESAAERIARLEAESAERIARLEVDKAEALAEAMRAQAEALGEIVRVNRTPSRVPASAGRGRELQRPALGTREPAAFSRVPPR